jgi:NAD(P)-dependent dehydrogenase (short-subunit alcohol dehydrogenase family)
MSAGQPGFRDAQDRRRELSALGDPLEKLAPTVDVGLFRGERRTALGRREGGKGGRPAFDPVLKVRMLLLQALHGLSLAQTEYLRSPAWRDPIEIAHAILFLTGAESAYVSGAALAVAHSAELA